MAKKKEGELPICDKTLSGNHLWVKLAGNIPEYASFDICIACGLVDDREKGN